MGRFDYVKYDEPAVLRQKDFKLVCEDLEKKIESEVKSSRAKKLALVALEVCYMWIGKGIRDDQIERNGSVPLQEERATE